MKPERHILFLHRKAKFPLTHRIKHNWLKSIKRIYSHLSFDFPRKDEIIRLACSIEKNRDTLCYGNRVEPDVINEHIENFYKLKEIFEEEGLSEIK